ncbi:DUF3788 family protein [Gorillibacterium sp. sgz500922]|uniref:DUF3788 family protein n=1 Tax=Gorillibacterium sp. sgz500922 TaxID=3446694 RepID=UPI003F67BE28
MAFDRMLDKNVIPARSDIYEFMGNQATDAWIEITDFLDENYDFEPETVFGGNNYGWCVRYRRSGKTLCALPT